MMSKQISLTQAAELVPSGDVVLALGGVTLYRRPLAFSLALMRRFESAETKPQLTLLCFTAGLESDLLVGAGLVASTRTCYFGLEAFGLAPNFTQAAAEGRLDIIEESEASLAFGLRAALAGVGFMPSLAWQGTDMLALRPDVKEVTDPYSGETLTAFPALHCDLAVIHALQADESGNAAIGRNWGVDRELAYMADQVVITAEEIVPELRRADIEGGRVAAVVEAPNGAWPTSCYPKHGLDGEALIQYIDSVGSPAYAALIETWSRSHSL